MSVYEKLMSVQGKLKSPKSQTNSFGHYQYRSCEDILEALKPLLNEVGAIVTLTDDIELVGVRTYIKATATFTDIEKGDSLHVSAYAREDEILKGMSLAQVTGSVSSYARKYSLNGLFCIDDTKDADFGPINGITKKDNLKVVKDQIKDLPTKDIKTANQVCEGCGTSITEKVAMYSTSKYKKKLCFDCQKKA